MLGGTSIGRTGWQSRRGTKRPTLGGSKKRHSGRVVTAIQYGSVVNARRATSSFILSMHVPAAGGLQPLIGGRPLHHLLDPR